MRKEVSERGDLAGFEEGRRGPLAKECGQPLETIKVGKWILPRASSVEPNFANNLILPH